MIRLSICMATLNRAAFIGVMIDSILSQMTEEVELVIVDGASTDGTDQVVAARFAVFFALFASPPFAAAA